MSVYKYNFKPGDVVRVTRPTNDADGPGWVSPEMNHMDGAVGTINRITGSSDHIAKFVGESFSYHLLWCEKIEEDVMNKPDPVDAFDKAMSIL